jgi:hypothetical protein
MVLGSVASPHSKRNDARALDDVFQFCASRPLSRALLLEWRLAWSRYLLHYECPSLGSAEHGRRGQANNMIGGGRQFDDATVSPIHRESVRIRMAVEMVNIVFTGMKGTSSIGRY